MTSVARLIEEVSKLDPRKAAESLVSSRQNDVEWLDAFREHLDHRRSGQSLARTLAAWDVSQSEAARLFGVSRQALSKWLDQGVPVERAGIVADLAAATDLLVHHLKRDRIPAVVRRAAPSLGDRSLLDLLRQGDSSALLQACRDMFSFDHAQAS